MEYFSVKIVNTWHISNSVLEVNHRVCSHGAWSRSSAESGFWPGVGVFEGDSNSVHVLLLDCTLSLVLRGFGRWTVLAVLLPQARPVIMPLCLLVHYCTPFIRRV